MRCLVPIAQMGQIQRGDITTGSGMRVKVDVGPFLVALSEGVRKEEQIGRGEMWLPVQVFCCFPLLVSLSLYWM